MRDVPTRQELLLESNWNPYQNSNMRGNLNKTTSALIKQSQLTRRYVNNPGNLPGPCPFVPRDEISRGRNPFTPIKQIYTVENIIHKQTSRCQVPLSDWGSHVVILYMFYATCWYTFTLFILSRCKLLEQV